MTRVLTRLVCSWRALPFPPMMQLVQSSHTLSLYSTRVLLARTTCAADNAASAIFTHLEPLLNLCAPCAYYLCRRCYSLCNFRTPRAYTLPMCSWRALPVPSMMQLVQSSHASGLHSTRRCCSLCNLRTPWAFTRPMCFLCTLPVPSMIQLVKFPHASSVYLTRVGHYLCRRQCSLYNLRTLRPFTRPVCSSRALPVSPMLQLVQSPHASRFYSTLVLLARTTCATDDAACTISARLRPLLYPCSPGTPCLCRQCYSLCNLRTPWVFTRPEFS